MDIKDPVISSVIAGKGSTSPKNGFIRRCIGSWEILMIFHGSIEIVYNSKKVEFCCDTPKILIYKPGFAYHFTILNSQFINVRVKLRKELEEIIHFTEIIDGMCCITPSPAIFRRTKRDLLEILETQRLQQKNWEPLAVSLAETVILRLIKSVSASESTSPKLAKAYTMLSTLEDICMKDIAEKCGLSVQMFYKLFKQETGSTPRSFHERFKLAEAKRLLIETNMTLSEIALQVNMYDQYYLSKRFKKYSKSSPSAFRKRIHDNGG